MPKENYCITCLSRIIDKEDLEFHKDCGHVIRFVDKKIIDKNQSQIDRTMMTMINKAVNVFTKGKVVKRNKRRKSTLRFNIKKIDIDKKINYD